MKQLNNLLREQGLCPFARHPNANLLKNLEDEYKRVKDHNNISRNNRETFTYYEDLNEITPKAVIEYGFEDDRLRNLPLQCQKQRKSYQTPVLETKRVNCLRMHFLGVNWLPPTKGSEASSEAGDEHLAFSELLFVRRKHPGSKAREKASGKSNQATAKKERIKWPQLQ